MLADKQSAMLRHEKEKDDLQNELDKTRANLSDAVNKLTKEKHQAIQVRSVDTWKIIIPLTP